MAQIKENWEKAQERLARKRSKENSPLAAILGGLDYEPPPREGCLLCQL
jgi:hypothetical protein